MYYKMHHQSRFLGYHIEKNFGYCVLHFIPFYIIAAFYDKADGGLRFEVCSKKSPIKLCKRMKLDIECYECCHPASEASYISTDDGFAVNKHTGEQILDPGCDLIQPSPTFTFEYNKNALDILNKSPV